MVEPGLVELRPGCIDMAGDARVRRLLVGCETSGKVRRAFAARGWEAWSCDYLPADDASPMHFQCDVRHILHALRGYFDLFIVHPSCQYLSVSGLHWNKRRPERAALTEDAIKFAVAMIEDCGIPRVVMENPIGCLSTRYRKPDQIIQPYQFGHDASKATCLWMRNVPPLVIDPALYVEPRLVCCGMTLAEGLGKYGCPNCEGDNVAKPRWANQTDSGQNKLTPSPDRWKLRSETYEGVAEAMAEQWSELA